MDFKHTLRQSTAYIADILAPNRCPCCSGFIKWDELLCNTCKNSLEPADDTSLPTPEGCVRALSAFRFKDPARQGIYSLKDGFGRNFARFTARILAESLDPSRFDLITCVPSYLERGSMKLRGHAETFARELSEITSLPCDVGLLYRKDTESKLHSGMSASERRECVKTMYAPSSPEEDLSGKRIILADDVLTTGSTLSACAAILKNLGAAEVTALTLCRTELPG